jgi:lipopolysaccharide heptosyltransferase II
LRKLTPRRHRLARIGDRLIRLLFRARRAAPTRAPEREPARILAVELWGLGDLVLATPALQSLRAAFPKAYIALLAAPEAEILLRHQTAVDDVIPWRAPWKTGRTLRSLFGPAAVRSLRSLRRTLRSRRFDTALDFRGDFRDNVVLWLSGAPRRIGFDFAGGGGLLTDVVPSHPDRHQADQALDVVAAVGGKSLQYGPRLWLSAHEIVWASRWLEEHGLERGEGPLVAIHPGAHWPGRRWETSRFARLAEALASEHGARILLVGGPEDAGLVRAVAREIRSPCVAVEPELRFLIALLAAADLFVGSDSGPIHIATAVGTPVVALFGPQRPEWFGPCGDGHRVAIADVPCRPCDQVVCARPSDSCMLRLDVQGVLELCDEPLRVRRRKLGGSPAE